MSTQHKTEIELIAQYRYGLTNGKHVFAPVSEWILTRIPTHLRAHAIAETRDKTHQRLLETAAYVVAKHGL